MIDQRLIRFTLGSKIISIFHKPKKKMNKKATKQHYKKFAVTVTCKVVVIRLDKWGPPRRFGKLGRIYFRGAG